MLPFVGPPTPLPYAPEAMQPPHMRKRSYAHAAPSTNTPARRPAPIYGGPAQAAAAQPPVLSAAQQAQQQQEHQRRAEAAKRQARKPTDRNLPEDLKDVCIGDGVDRYNKLRELERRLDATMMQKRLDVNEEITAARKREGTLRIWISNTAEGQPWQVIEEGGEAFGADGTFDFGENSQARYRVKIEGRLLPDAEEDIDDQDEDAMDEDTEGAVKQIKKLPKMPLPNEKTKLSHFFSNISIDFDRPASLQPDGFTNIEWKKPAPANPPLPGQQAGADAEANFDVLEFERKSDEEISISINLTRDESPERFKLSPALADLLDADEDTRAGVVAGIWEYVRAMGLQEAEETRRIACDDRLRAVRLPVSTPTTAY